MVVKGGMSLLLTGPRGSGKTLLLAWAASSTQLRQATANIRIAETEYSPRPWDKLTSPTLVCIDVLDYYVARRRLDYNPMAVEDSLGVALLTRKVTGHCIVATAQFPQQLPEGVKREFDLVGVCGYDKVNNLVNIALPFGIVQVPEVSKYFSRFDTTEVVRR